MIQVKKDANAPVRTPLACRQTPAWNPRQGRYGGEEFLLAATETSADTALKLAERVRGMALEIPVPDMGDGETTIRVTVSAGVAERSVGEEVEKAISRADAALYAAKAAGRNRVELG